MSLVSTRIVGVLATATLVVIPLASASTASAASKGRDTSAMEQASLLGMYAASYAEDSRRNGRSVSTLRTAMRTIAEMGAKTTGLVDRNKDGLDDDGKLTFTYMGNVATLTVRKDRKFTVRDAGFILKNRSALLKESAQSADRNLRFMGTHGAIDTWDMIAIGNLQHDLPAGVKVLSAYDGNKNGFDDDGRLTFVYRGKYVTLTIGNTVKAIGKVTNGPTWKNKAPKRKHVPAHPSNEK